MDYSRLYNALMAKASNRLIVGYAEKHHVVPRCMGGANEKGNIVLLTAKEHFVAHKLLVRVYPDVRGLWLALVAMGRIAGFKARIFSSERERAALSRKGFKYTEESRQKMSVSAKARGRNSPNTEFKKGQTVWNAGLPPEKSHRYGIAHSLDTKEKISDSMLKSGVRPPAPPLGFRWGKGGVLIPKKLSQPQLVG